MLSKLEIAEKALSSWIIAVKTGVWEPYLDLLTEDYTFWLSEGGYVTPGIDLKESKEQLLKKEFNERRLAAYQSSPDRISAGTNTVVFEFIFDAKKSKEYYQNSMAISFDIRDNKISACREYHCVLLNM